MIGVIIGILAIFLGVSVILRRTGAPVGSHRVVRIFTSRIMGIFLTVVGVFMLLSSSFIFVDANYVGHLKRIYTFKELPPGRIIALEDEKGPQAQILGPGFHFIPLVRVLYDFEEWEVIEIPEGYYGQLTALDRPGHAIRHVHGPRHSGRPGG